MSNEFSNPCYLQHDLGVPLRKSGPDASFADLYNETTMPPELRAAHQANDREVCAAYGWGKDDEPYRSEAACVAALMKLYQKYTQGR